MSALNLGTGHTRRFSEDLRTGALGGELAGKTPAQTCPAAQGGVVAAGDRQRLPVLPPWASSRSALAAHTAAAARRARYCSARHAARSPVYAARLLVRAAIGTGRGIARLSRWVTAAEYQPLIGEAAADGQWSQRLSHYQQRGQVAKERAKKACYATAGAVGVVAVAVAALGVWVLWLLAAIAAAAAIAAGRREHDQRVVDELEAPAKIALAPEHLNNAFTAAGLLKGSASLVLCSPILRDGQGWATVADLPRGSGKTAADVLAQRTTIAAELGVDEIQVIMNRVRAAAGGHAGRFSLWVADDDPYLGAPMPSPLQRADAWSIWDRLPYGQDARGRRIELDIMWQSMFFGGLPRRGKTFAQRLVSAAGVLDPYVRHYVADGKGGADWKPIRAVAHRLIMGAEDDALAAFIAMLDELVCDMERRFKALRDLPVSQCPQGKLTPDIVCKYDLPVTMVTIDELQEYLTALDTERREYVINQLCRIARRGPAAGYILNVASQRPDAASVPTKLREIITVRYCTQVVDRTSSDMVLGKGKAGQGADASILSEDHKGVGVLVTGPGSHVIARCDYMDVPAFTEVCARGRDLREEAGTLSGDAAADAIASAQQDDVAIAPVLSDCLDVMHHVDRMFTTDLINGLVNLDEAYGDYDPERLAVELERAGVTRTSKQVKIAGENRNGYRRADLEGAIPNIALLPSGRGRGSTEERSGPPLRRLA